MPEQRRITRISGRRLFDEQERQPTTLERIAELIKDGTAITVLDRKGNRDITTSILIQIIEKIAGQGVPVLTADVLRDLIRLRPEQPNAAHSENAIAELRIVNSGGLMKTAAKE